MTEQRADVLDLLDRFPLLADLAEAERKAVAAEVEERAGTAGEVLLLQGKPSEGCGLILAGSASVRVDGVEVTRLGPGDVFGEISALLDEPAMADVVAVGPLRYLALPAERFRTLLQTSPPIAYTLLRAEARRLRSPGRWLAGGRRRHGRDRSDWAPDGWRTFPTAQQPDWPDPGALDDVVRHLRQKPPLVFAGEARRLTAKLAEVGAGRAFLLQAGDCAESFNEFSADSIRDKLKVSLQMSAVLTHGAGVPIVKVGRIAGQFAKPRSSATETVAGVVLPAFRGDIVNAVGTSEEARRPDPQRMVDAYHQSMETLNLLRAFTTGGYASLANVHAWNQDFVASSPEGERYREMADEIHRSLLFMRACGIDPDTELRLQHADYWTSHEALLLPYEEALTRVDSTTGDWYDCSAHMLWIGERTRQLDGGHLEFLSGVENPLGCKLGPTVTPDDAVAICERLNPERAAGRLTLISRMGAGAVRAALPPILAAVRDEGHPVAWACDPMHGNTTVTSTGRKTRHFEAIFAEVEGFFAACHAEGVWPGGLHVELTGDDVTECLGGSVAISEADLDTNYLTACDPRLNARQSLDLAFAVAEMVRGLRDGARR